jgi:hypothetical protein
MKNIFLIPTENSSRLSIKDGVLILHRQQWRKGTQNIYITSDEEIKEGDWFLNDMNILFKAGKNYIENPAKEVYIGHKKIILTTDPKLIEDGVQAIDDDFLEWFVKNTSCEEVEVSHLLKSIFDPKTNEKYPVVQHRHFDLDKMICEYKYEIIIPKEEYKQETLEEFAERFYGEEEIVNDYDISGYLQSAFLTGAKWQQERSYSEEEKNLLEMLHKFGFDYTYNYKGEKTIYEWIPEWFEEYKRLEQLNK